MYFREISVPNNPALDFDTREEAVKESSVHSRVRRITLTQHAMNSTFHAGGSSPD